MGKVQEMYGIKKVESKIICNKLGIMPRQRIDGMTISNRRKLTRLLEERTRIIKTQKPSYVSARSGLSVSM
jgi:ribosomal protein S13